MEPAATQYRPPFEIRNHCSASGRAERQLIMLIAIINFLRSWKRYNASLNELNQLGDRELADIGITRSDIPRIAWDTAQRERF